MSKKGSGWHGEPRRHSLAGKGVKTRYETKTGKKVAMILAQGVLDKDDINFFWNSREGYGWGNWRLREKGIDEETWRHLDDPNVAMVMKVTGETPDHERLWSVYLTEDDKVVSTYTTNQPWMDATTTLALTMRELREV